MSPASGVRVRKPAAVGEPFEYGTRLHPVSEGGFYTTSRPDGAANAELIKLLAKRLGVPRRTLTIASGQSSRTKLIDIEDLSLAELRDKLAQLLS